LERNDIYQNWQNPNMTLLANPTLLVTPLAILVCPSNPAPVTGSNPLSFVVNTGSANTANDNLLAQNATPNWPEDINSGVFFDQTRDANQLQWDYKIPPKAKVTMDFIGTNDGTSYTLMMSENLQAFNWALDPTDTLGTTKFQSDFSVRQGTGMVWYITGNTNNAGPPTTAAGANYNALAIPINGQAKVVSGAPAAVYPSMTATQPSGLAFARPSSNHPGGVNAFFCDGHGRFIAEDIGYNVYTQLMTPNQKAVVIAYPMGPPSPATLTSSLISPGPWTYLLNETDY
jgi:prepilin-type processing-associated H-X9-DG protein